MRIGNNYLPPLSSQEEGAAPRSKPAHQALTSTTDLVAMSNGVRFESSLQAAETAREARVRQLADSWRSGAYRPDAQRIADKLIGWGFESGEVQQ
jgi:anti-sigma28 factor (negative regulator of flagellin synthesis)